MNSRVEGDMLVLFDGRQPESAVLGMVLKRSFQPAQVWEEGWNAPRTGSGARSEKSCPRNWQALSGDEQKAVGLVISQVPFGIHELDGRSARYVAVVDAPGFSKSSAAEPGTRPPLEEIPGEIRIRQFAGVAPDCGDEGSHLERALKSVRNGDLLVGLSERLDESLVLLARDLGLPLRQMRHLYPQRKRVDASASPASEKEANNDYLRLYEVCVDVFEQRVREYGPHFRRDTQYFRVLNAAYKLALTSILAPIAFTKWTIRRTIRLLFHLVSRVRASLRHRSAALRYRSAALRYRSATLFRAAAASVRKTLHYTSPSYWRARFQVEKIGRDPLLRQVTLVIPTHCRHQYLERALDHYRNWNVDLVVADSTEQPFSASLPDGVTYLHRPGLGYGKKISEVLDTVETPLVLLAADDDFISPVGVLRATEYLLEHPECACAQGWHAGFQRSVKGRKTELVWYALHVFAKKYRVAEQDAPGRISRQAQLYMNNFYAVHRTEVMRYFFCNIRPSLSQDILARRPDLLEVAQALSTVTWGPHIVLPVFWIARESIADSAGAECPVSLNSDPDAATVFTQLAENLLEPSGVENLQDCFAAAREQFLTYRGKWERGEIEHMAVLDEVVESAVDRAVIARITSMIRRYPFPA